MKMSPPREVGVGGRAAIPTTGNVVLTWEDCMNVGWKISISLLREGCMRVCT